MTQHPAIDKVLYIGGVYTSDDKMQMKLGNAHTHPIPAERDARSAGPSRRVLLTVLVAKVEELPNDA